MNAPRRAFAALATSFVGLVAVCSSAAGADEGLRISEVDTTGHPAVSLVVTVPGELVGTDLRNAFTLEEAGEAIPVKVTPISSAGLHVVLVVDTSGSMDGEPMAAARAAATRFVDLLPAGTTVAVLGFGQTPSLAAPFTSDRPRLRAAIGELTPGGETALHDALIAAAAQLDAVTTSRRAVVVLSDGGDTVSAGSEDDAASALAATGADVSIVELTSGETDHAALARIADATSGDLVQAADPAALEAAYRTVSADLVGRYRLTYSTAVGGNSDLTLSVRAGGSVISTKAPITYPGGAPAASSDVAATTAASPGLLGSGAALLAGAALLFVGLLVAAATAVMPRRRTNVLVARGARGTRAAQGPGISMLAERAGAAAERRLQASGRKRSIDAALEQAGIALRAGELVVFTAVAVAVSVLLGSALGGPVLGLLFGALPVAAVKVGLGLVRDRRRKAFDGQLPDLLQLLAGSLRAGYGLMQALESASREAESPAADELRRLTTEVRLGRDVTDALEGMAQRVANDDFEWVAQAIRINREIGGDLAEVLDRVAETIRSRQHLRRQVAALSAEGKMSAGVLMSLPFGLVLMMGVTNPDYIGLLVSRSIGWVMVGMATVLLTAGGVWLKILIRPKF